MRYDRTPKLTILIFTLLLMSLPTTGPTAKETKSHQHLIQLSMQNFRPGRLEPRLKRSSVSEVEIFASRDSIVTQFATEERNEQ